MLKLLLILFTFGTYSLLFLVLYVAIIALVQKKLKQFSQQKYRNGRVISFLHPFCNDCGGGEKVLWMILKGMCMGQQTKDKIKVNILCGVRDDAALIKKNLRDRFEIDFNNESSERVIDIELVRLKTAHLLKPKSFFTLCMQMIGQIVFAFEIITKVYSETIVDTTGLPFTYFVLKILGRANMVAYVHYPLISGDMISDIQNSVAGVHSRGFLSKFKIMRHFKVLYYYIILFLYKFNGFFVDLAFCNSTWTFNHMKNIWKGVKSTILYPPCSTKLYETNHSNLNRKNIMVSFAQFRPEKRHKMQVDILKKLKETEIGKDLKLCIIGSIRGEGDRKIFDDLQEYINKCGLYHDVELCPNLPLNEVKKKFDTAKIGLHTMRDEHFGISITEMMAAGLLTVAHKSAGPLNDIIGPSENIVGILADGMG